MNSVNGRAATETTPRAELVSQEWRPGFERLLADLESTQAIGESLFGAVGPAGRGSNSGPGEAEETVGRLGDHTGYCCGEPESGSGLLVKPEVT